MDSKFSQLLALLGQQIEREDPTALFQCMDFAFAWVDILGIDRASIRHPYAYQVWTKPNDLTVQFFQFIPNTANGVPQQGDIVIFDQNVQGVTGIAGHICVATGGDSNSFNSLDQNWKGVQKVTKEKHSYTGVLGWLRIKLANISQEELDQMRKDRDQNYNNWVEQLKQTEDLKKQIVDFDNQLKECQISLANAPSSPPNLPSGTFASVSDLLRLLLKKIF